MPVINNGHNHTAINTQKPRDTRFPLYRQPGYHNINTPDLLIPVRAAEAKQIYESPVVCSKEYLL